jgi:Kef-type K+ transport system membrane component KefB
MMHRFRPLRFLPFVFALLLLPRPAWASEGAATPAVWLALAGILLVAKLAGEVAVRFKQPPVLGELVAGILLGNLSALGFTGLNFVSTSPVFAFLAELGVVLLLFEVGLESTLGEMAEVAPSSGIVAALGVAVPFGLGALVSGILQPDAPLVLHLFLGATLAATSVGITARVLRDLGALGGREARVILGAAVLDDVMGLVLLALVTGMATQGEAPGVGTILRLVGTAAGFLFGAVLLARTLMPGAFRTAARLQTEGVLGALIIGFCLVLAGVSELAGLAAIVGAFAAGLVLDKVHVEPFGGTKHDLADLVRPIVAVLAPVFFVRTGMSVDLGGVDGSVLLLAGALTVVAVVGKLAAGLGVRGGQTDRWLVAIGMVPRGEVGLIFADAGSRIVRHGQPLIPPPVYVAVVLVVLVTTLITPPWLSARLARSAKAPS